MDLLPFSGVAILLLISLFWILVAFLIFRKKAKWGFWLLCSLALLLIYNNYCRNLDELFSVSIDSCSFNEILNKSKWPLRLGIITVNNTEYVEAIIAPGKVESLVRLTTLRSGMPAYIFDMEGHLVDSTIDHHDEARYQDKWARPDTRQSVSRDEVLKRINRGQKK